MGTPSAPRTTEPGSKPPFSREAEHRPQISKTGTPALQVSPITLCICLPLHQGHVAAAVASLEFLLVSLLKPAILNAVTCKAIAPAAGSSKGLTQNRFPDNPVRCSPCECVERLWFKHCHTHTPPELAGACHARHVLAKHLNLTDPPKVAQPKPSR